MHFVLQTPSLQHLAGVKIVAHFWSQGDIFTQIARLSGNDVRNDTMKWKELEEKVKSKVWALPLPPLCKKQFLSLIKPLGMEIIRWCRYHCEKKTNFQFLNNLLPLQLCWTMHGTVDYAKTAELIVKDDKVDMEKRYEIACINCLKDGARELFHCMGEERRQEYVARVRNRRGLHYHQLVCFFNYSLNGEEACLQKYWRRPSSFHKCLFQDALYDGTRATCEYLFSKLNQREKEQVVEEWRMPTYSFIQASSGGCVSVDSVLFNLSLLNEEQQERVLRRNVYDLLQCFLRWPMQSLFVKAAKWGWQFMDNQYRCRNQVLRDIIFKISQGLPDYDYVSLFWECWRLSSAEYKQDFLNNVQHLERLFKTKQEEFFELVFKEAPWYPLKELVEKRYGKIRPVLTDERVISDAALMEFKETAALSNSNDEESEGKRLRSEYVSRLVDMAMERRIKRRRFMMADSPI